MIAAGMGHHECVDFLLKMGAEKDAQNNHGYTALMDASAEGNHGVSTSSLKQGLQRTPNVN